MDLGSGVVSCGI